MLTAVGNRLVICALIFLSACAHVEGVKTLSSYSASSKKAMIIGRVKISPRIDDNGKVHPVGGNTPNYFNVFSKDPTLRRKTGEGLDLDPQMDFFTRPVPADDFFAFEVDPGPLAWIGISGFIARRNFWSKMSGSDVGKYQGTFQSYVRGTTGVIHGPLTAGKVHYVGTMNIVLDQKSYIEEGDQKYDMMHVIYVVPKKIEFEQERELATQWAKKEFGYDGPIEWHSVDAHPNEMQSTYQQWKQTTVRY